MRRLALICALLLAATACAASSLKAHAPAMQLYVATNGSDANSGLTPASPLATIAGAGAKIAALRSAGGAQCYPDVTVVLVAGVYFSKTSQPQVLQPDVLRGKSTCASTVTFEPASANATDVFVSGGYPIRLAPPTKPTPASLFFETRVVLAQEAFPQQHVWNMWKPRRSNSTSNAAAFDRVPQCISPVSYYTAFTGKDSSPPNTQFLSFTSSNFPVLQNATSDEIGSFYVRMYHSWTSTYSKIFDYAASALQIVFAGHLNDCTYNTATGSRYEMVNVPPTGMPPAWQAAVLNTPGATCFTYRSVSATTVELRLFGKTAFSTSEPFIVPVMATVLAVANAAPQSSLGPVAPVALRRLAFGHTDTLLDEDCPMGCSQSGAALQHATVMTANTQLLAFTGCRFLHTGGYALWLNQGTVASRVERCEFADLGAGGIRVGPSAGGQSVNDSLECHDLTIADNRIHDGGHVEQAGCGVLLQRAYNASIVHNAIFDLYYTGVSTGWTWGWAPTSNRNLNVSFNHIYNIGRATLSDMGCIYNLGISPGTVFVNNVCHDVVSFGYGGWGYYADEGTSDVLWQNNIAYRTKGAGYHQHYGLNNVVLNNVLAFPFSGVENPNGDRSCLRSSAPDSGYYITSFTVKRNILLIDNVNSTLFYSTSSGSFTNVTFAHNTYWSNVTALANLQFPPTQDPTTWAAWSQRDTTSIVADPLFLNAGQYDFSSMAANSPAIVKCGFQPISVKDVGPRK